MQIILFEPKIPQNTGNIARSCAAVGCSLRLVPPLGFSLDESRLKRAGLDYWGHVDWGIMERKELEELLNRENPTHWLFSSKGKMRYDKVTYRLGDSLVFGSEPSGLPKEWLAERSVQIPQREGIRCLNLSTATGIGLFEAWRQLDFCALGAKVPNLMLQ